MPGCFVKISVKVFLVRVSQNNYLAVRVSKVVIAAILPITPLTTFNSTIGHGSGDRQGRVEVRILLREFRRQPQLDLTHEGKLLLLQGLGLAKMCLLRLRQYLSCSRHFKVY